MQPEIEETRNKLMQQEMDFQSATVSLSEISQKISTQEASLGEHEEKLAVARGMREEKELILRDVRDSSLKKRKNYAWSVKKHLPRDRKQQRILMREFLP